MSAVGFLLRFVYGRGRERVVTKSLIQGGFPLSHSSSCIHVYVLRVSVNYIHVSHSSPSFIVFLSFLYGEVARPLQSNSPRFMVMTSAHVRIG